MRRSLLLVAALALTCGGPDHSHDAASVVVHASGSGPLVISTLGGTLQLVADVKDAAGRSVTGITVVWGSSNAIVATVDANGLVTGVANGTASIVATAGSVHGSLDVTVAQAISTVQVTPAATRVPPNSPPFAYSATALDAHGDPVAGAPAATWASDNPQVTLDASGNATVGAFTTVTTVTITATIGGVSGHATLTVDPSAVSIACIVVSGGGVTLTSIGDTAQLSAVAYATCPNTGPISNVTFSWSSGDLGRVSVDSNGLVTAHANTPSPVTITASAGVKNGTATISVSQAAASVSAAGSTTLSNIGDTVQLTALDSNSHAIANSAVTWAPQSTGAATVDATGLATAKTDGSQSISATAGSRTATITLTVQAVATVSVSPATASIASGTTQQFTATAKDSHATVVTGAPAASWDTSDHTVATISSSGLATGVSAGGPVTVTATINDGASHSGTAQLTVTAAAKVHTVSWSLSPNTHTSLTINLGDQVQWHGTDSYAHTATSCTNGMMGCTSTSAFTWDTGNISAGTTSKAITFTQKGTFPYCCSYHQCLYMSGAITVQ